MTKKMTVVSTDCFQSDAFQGHTTATLPGVDLPCFQMVNPVITIRVRGRVSGGNWGKGFPVGKIYDKEGERIY